MNIYPTRSWAYVYFFAGVFLFLALFTSVFITYDQQFVYLARAFLKGQTYLTECPQNQCLDFSQVNGRYFWPLGPLPAAIMAPFVFVSDFFNFFFYQYHLNFLLTVLVFGLILKIARHLGYSREDGIYWGVAFCFASPFLAVAFVPTSWFFSHVVAVSIFLLLVEGYLKERGLWYLSLLSGLLILTRVTAGVSASIFLTFLILPRLISADRKESLRKTLSSLFPLMVCLGLYLLYNYVRFGSLLESGYSSQIVRDYFSTARAYGLFSLTHLPGNLYYALLSTPLPVFNDNVSHILKFPYFRNNPWGMSIFVTSPYLIYIFFLDYKDRLLRILLFTSVFSSLLIFLYFGIGFFQFGYRYLLDVFPLLIFILMRGYRQKSNTLSLGFKFVILISALVDFYLLLGSGLVPVVLGG